MKPEEEKVFKYLQSHGHKDIQYEPDGNVPPDFLINGEIAIEVRRLNKYIDVSNRKEPIEKADFQVQGLFRKIIEDIPVEDYEHSIFLLLDFKRPINVKDYRRDIVTTLKEHLETPKKITRYKFGDNLTVRTHPASSKLETVYRVGAISDEDSGGFIVSEIYDVLPFILNEKENKISEYKDRYSKWWLALVDTIGYGLSSHDFAQFRELPVIKTDFDKVLVVSPVDHSKGFFIID